LGLATHGFFCLVVVGPVLLVIGMILHARRKDRP
jgi:hypothetical protein